MQKQDAFRQSFNVFILEAVRRAMTAIEISGGMDSLDLGSLDSLLDMLDQIKITPEDLPELTKELYALSVKCRHLTQTADRLDQSIALLVNYQAELVLANKLDTTKVWSPLMVSVSG